MKKLILIPLFLTCLITIGQVQLDSAFVYSNLFEGGTSASVSHKFSASDSLNSPKIQLNSGELSELNMLIAQGRRKKHYQQKFSSGNLYILTYCSGREEKLLVTGGGGIVNFSIGKEYNFRNENIHDLKSFFDRLKNRTITQEAP